MGEASLVPFVCGLLILASGVITVVRTKKSFLSFSCFLASFALFSYCLALFGHIEFSRFSGIYKFWISLFLSFGFFITPALLNILRQFDQKDKLLRFVSGLSLAMSVGSLLLWTDRFAVEGVNDWPGVAGFGSFPFALFFLNSVLLLPLGILIFLIKRHRPAGIATRQVKFIASGVAFVATGVIFTFSPVFGLDLFWGVPLVAAAFVFVAFSVNNCRLLEADLILNRTVLTVLMLVPLLILHALISRLFSASLGLLLATTFSLTVIVLIILFTPYTRLVQKTADRTVYKGRYNYQKILEELSSRFVSIPEFDQLLDYITHSIVQTIEPEQVVIFLMEDKQLRLCSRLGSEDCPELLLIDGQDLLVRRLSKGRGILVRSEMRQYEDPAEVEELFKTLRLFPAELVVPLFYKSVLQGIIVLGPKKNGQIYNGGDFKALRKVAIEAAVAVENSRLQGEAVVDRETGIFNRNYFLMRLEEDVERSRRYGNPMSLLLVGLNGMDEIDRQYGLGAVEMVLKQTARELKNRIRNVDIIARYSRYIFAIILPQTAFPEKAVGQDETVRFHVNDVSLAAARILQSVKDLRPEFSNNRLSLKASIGGAVCNGGKTQLDREDLLKKALQALETADKMGSDRIEFGTGVI